MIWIGSSSPAEMRQDCRMCEVGGEEVQGGAGIGREPYSLELAGASTTAASALFQFLLLTPPYWSGGAPGAWPPGGLQEAT